MNSQPIELTYNTIDLIKELMPKRKIGDHLYANCRMRNWWKRYIQFATSYINSNKCIHYEICSNGYLEFHIEGEYDSKYSDLSKYLYLKSQDNDNLQWFARDFYELGTCRYNHFISSEEELSSAILSFCGLIDSIIDHYKSEVEITYNVDDYDISRLDSVINYCIKGDEVSLMDNLTLNDVFHLAINIPSYQRIYCWEEKNVRQLFDDIMYLSGQYRMGTIILHHHDKVFDIIDGQQRLVTLSLILRRLGYSQSPILQLSFQSQEAMQYVAYNRSIIDDFISSYIISDRRTIIRNILEYIEFSVLVLNTDNIDLAYTFFSNENSRGKSLSDFDLLKAHHLRYIKEEVQAEHLAKGWDHMLSDANKKYDSDLDKPYYRSLGLYIFRLRNWMRKDNWDDFMPHKIKNEYEAAPTIEEIPAYGERFIFNETIQGGSHFFSFVKQFEYKFNLFADTDEYKAIHKVNGRTHWWFRDIIETLLFGYYLKFNVEYLSEALIGISRIVSQYRYDFNRADYGRLLKQAGDSGIVFLIDRSTSPTFVLAELENKIKLLPAINTNMAPISLEFQRLIKGHLDCIKKEKIVINSFKHLL